MSLGFRAFSFKGLRVLGLRAQGFRGLGLRGLGFRVLGCWLRSSRVVILCSLFLLAACPCWPMSVGTCEERPRPFVSVWVSGSEFGDSCLMDPQLRV